MILVTSKVTSLQIDIWEIAITVCLFMTNYSYLQFTLCWTPVAMLVGCAEKHPI